MRCRLLALIGAIALGSAGGALAADMPVKAPVLTTPAAVVAYNWSGVYAGANAGAASQRNCWIFTTPPGGPADEGCHQNTNAVAGGQLGVNWQTGNIVVGLEASGNWANLRGSNVSIAFPDFTNETRTDAIGLFTARIGAAWNNVLAYVKGGAAMTHNRYAAFLTAAPNSSGVVTDWRWGWTVGAGLEYGFAPNWSAAIEYDYINAGSKDELFPAPSTPCGITPCTDRVTQRIHMATLRLNYRFAPWVGR